MEKLSAFCAQNVTLQIAWDFRVRKFRKNICIISQFSSFFDIQILVARKLCSDFLKCEKFIIQTAKS